MRRHHPKIFLFAFLLLLMVIPFVPVAYAAPSANQIVTTVNESDLVQLTGNVHPLASPEFDEGLVADGLRMEHMFVVLRRSPEQEQALQQLAVALQNPHSASYHKWLTADQLGKSFGPSQQDIETVVKWLESHGLQVNLVHKSGM